MPDDQLPAVLGSSIPATLGLDEYSLVKLARSIAQNIYPLPKILEDAKISDEDFQQYVKTNPFFQQAFRAYLMEWESAGSSDKRIQIKAASALEDSLPHLNARMNDKAEALPAVIDTARLFAKIAGVEGTGQKQTVGEKVTITIDLGEGRNLKFEKEATPTEDKVIDVTPNPTLP